MVDPATMGAVSLGSTVLGGVTNMFKANTNASAQKLGIQGQMLQTMSQAFGFRTQAQQSEYQANINKYQAGVADINKELAEGNARYAKEVGEVEAQQSAMKSHADLGEMIAHQGSSGLSVNTGSSVAVRESMIEIGKYSQDVIRASAAKKAYGYTVEAMQYGAQADVYRYTAEMNEDQAKNALTAAGMTEKSLGLEQQAMNLVDTSKNLNILGSLVSTGSSVATKWSEGEYKGLTSSIGSMFG